MYEYKPWTNSNVKALKKIYGNLQRLREKERIDDER